MDLQISKKQFIIITVLVIAITAVAISLVIKNKTNSEDIVNNNQTNQTNVENKKETVIKNENDNKDEKDETTIENEKEEIKNEEIDEEEINTSTKGQKIASLIKQVEQSDIFTEMTELSQDEIDDFMDIDVSLLDEYVIKMSNSRFKSDLYMILKPSDNNEETIMNQVKSFLINYENSWVNLDYKQYDLISNRKAIKRNGYLIYVVSSNNDEFLNIVRNNI